MARTSVLLGTLLLLAALLPRPSAAQSSALVPPGDPAYAEMDALVGAGLVRDAPLAQKPWSRLAFARMAGEAAGRAEEGEGALAPRVREALARLQERFEPEASLLCEGGEGCPAVEPGLRLLDARVDGTWARSPDRPARTSYRDRSLIDAQINPLLQRNDGRVLVDGWTAGAEVGAEARLGRGLVAVARPRVRALGPDGADTDAEVTARELYLRGVVGNLAVEVGRRHVFEGHGRNAGVILSRNPRGLDMVRISNARPFRLPWILGALGPTDASAFLADMGEDRDTPGSKLIMLRWSIRPHENFELGGSLLNHQGGEGAPEASFWDRVKDIIPVQEIFGPQISDKVAGLDARLTLPDQGFEAFLEWSNTDFNLHLDRFGEMMGDEAAWVGGLRFHRLGSEGRGTLWIEGHYAGVRPFTHHQFTSGLTVDGRIIGQPVGPLGRGFAAGLDWTGSAHALSVSGAVERYNGDDYQGNGEQSGDFRWNVVADNPDEVRLRAEVAWAWQEGAVGLRPWARVGVERVSRFAFTEEDRTNALLQVGLSRVW